MTIYNITINSKNLNISISKNDKKPMLSTKSELRGFYGHRLWFKGSYLFTRKNIGGQRQTEKRTERDPDRKNHTESLLISCHGQEADKNIHTTL